MAECYEAAGAVAKRVLESIKSYRDGDYKDQYVIRTGYQQIDDIIGGFHSGELAVIAGRPSMGKTALALNIVRKIAITGDGAVGYISLEDGEDVILEKLLTMDSMIDFTVIRTKDLSEKNMKGLEESADRISKSKIFISDCRNADINSVCSVCDAMKKDNDIQIVFIDYAQLIKGKSDGSRALEMAEILDNLKELAYSLQIPVILMSQLSREVDTRMDHRPTITDFPVKEVVECMADTMLFLYRDDYYNRESDMKGIAEVIVAKHCNDRAGTAKLVWNPINYMFC
ncbi:hypothetical protein D6855_14225 [Butyrivibrio sp. CB08]|uniref:DnaB-like helicase C-terminal domain-containing protein n=1 Tax=Butyrivibrio sp. CB08 TaxID=2364879 RepID=UPI000EA8C89E|nr:DnaB-like helicase C-terminal domain-containing protein [Butyrivibrio sp. CB08]RKM56821.1 hypothetical protein D6855_14225 [Butyrivibrio sp. CB08]